MRPRRLRVRHPGRFMRTHALAARANGARSSSGNGCATRVGFIRFFSLSVVCERSGILAEASALIDPDPANPPSPCIDACRLDKGYAYCIGCHRTIDEIKRWSTMTAAEQRAVIETLPARRGACDV
jgi:predicted Fe-S protein YdhL (DUF1289 family)